MEKIRIENFWYEAKEEQLRELMEYAEDKEIRDKSSEYYNWNESTEHQLRNLMIFAKDKKQEKKLPNIIIGMELQNRN